MKKYQVFYMKPSFFADGLFGKRADVRCIEKTHVFLGEVKAVSLEGLFRFLQGEVWSPNGEARDLLRSKGLNHTSMSIGDIAVDSETGEVYQVASMGFSLLGAINVVPRDVLPTRDEMRAGVHHG